MRRFPRPRPSRRRNYITSQTGGNLLSEHAVVALAKKGDIDAAIIEMLDLAKALQISVTGHQFSALPFIYISDALSARVADLEGTSTELIDGFWRDQGFLGPSVGDAPKSESAVVLDGACSPSSTDESLHVLQSDNVTGIVSMDMQNLYFLWEHQLQLDNQLQLDLPTYHAFLAHIQWKNGAEGRGLLDNIRRCGAIPTVCIYEKLLLVCIEKHDLDAAVGILKEMWRSHMAPDEDIYASLLYYAEQELDWAESDARAEEVRNIHDLLWGALDGGFRPLPPGEASNSIFVVEDFDSEQTQDMVDLFMADPQLAPLVGHIIAPEPSLPTGLDAEPLPIPHGDELAAAGTCAREEEEIEHEQREAPFHVGEEGVVCEELREVVEILDASLGGTAQVVVAPSQAVSEEQETLRKELERQKHARKRGEDDTYATWHVGEIIGKQHEGNNCTSLSQTLPWLRLAEAPSSTIWDTN